MEKEKKPAHFEEVLEQQTTAVKKLLNAVDEHFKLLEKDRKFTETEFYADVKKWGNSAHIPTLKKWIGQKAKVRIFKKKEGGINI